MSARRGFTLLEVLVALSIFALAAVVLGTAYVNVLNSYAVASRLNEGREEVSFARSLLLAEAELKKVEEGGEFDSVEQRRVRWTAKVEPTSTADLFQVSFVCDVTLPSPAKPLHVEETFLTLRPTWSEAADREKLRADARTRIEELNAGRAR